MSLTDTPDKKPPTIPEAIAGYCLTKGEELGMFKLFDWISKTMKVFGYG
jgi:hypothetical protein